MSGVATTVDPVRLAVVANRLKAVVRKMSNTLYRTGRSGVLNTARDFSCALVTKDDRLLMAADSLPIHVLSGPDLMAAYMREVHPELRPGDAFLHNSPYHGNSHPADHSLLVPVVDAEGEHRMTILVKAHQADCGNALPTTYMGSAADVYAEGALIFPAVQIQRQYRDCEDVVRMCEARIRVPEQWRGDYLAMLGAARIGEREIAALADELGYEELDACTEGWFDYSEELMVKAIQRLGDGEGEAESSHDPYPGAPDGIPVKAAVAVDAEAARVTIDMRDNPDCVANGLNLSEACSRTAAMIGLFNCLDGEVPTNAGSFRRVEVLLRENCVVGIPRHPTSCSVATTNVADRATSAVQMAIAAFSDGHGMAAPGGFGAPVAAVVSGHDPRQGDRPFVNQLFLVLSGGAGSALSDGWLTFCHAGNGGMLYVDSVEVDELNFPILVRSQRIVPDSAGAGRFRGAPAVETEYGPLATELRVIYASDGAVNAAAGVRQGRAGACSWQKRRRADGSSEPLAGHGEVTLAAGETILTSTASGGGYGPPSERAADLVAHDVREGWVSAEAARGIYGVVLDDRLEIDPEATRRQRADPVSGTGARRASASD